MFPALLCGLFYGWLLAGAWHQMTVRQRRERIRKAIESRLGQPTHEWQKLVEGSWDEYDRDEECDCEQAKDAELPLHIVGMGHNCPRPDSTCTCDSCSGYLYQDWPTPRIVGVDGDLSKVIRTGFEDG